MRGAGSTPRPERFLPLPLAPMNVRGAGGNLRPAAIDIRVARRNSRPACRHVRYADSAKALSGTSIRASLPLMICDIRAPVWGSSFCMKKRAVASFAA